MAAAAANTFLTPTAVDPDLTSDVIAAVSSRPKASVSTLQILYVRAAAANNPSAMIMVVMENFYDVGLWAAKRALWEALARNHPSVVRCVATGPCRALNDPASSDGQTLAVIMGLNAIFIEVGRKRACPPGQRGRTRAMAELVGLPAFRDMRAELAEGLTHAARDNGLPWLFAGVFTALRRQ